MNPLSPPLTQSKRQWDHRRVMIISLTAHWCAWKQSQEEALWLVDSHLCGWGAWFVHRCPGSMENITHEEITWIYVGPLLFKVSNPDFYFIFFILMKSRKKKNLSIKKMILGKNTRYLWCLQDLFFFPCSSLWDRKHKKK